MAARSCLLGTEGYLNLPVFSGIFCSQLHPHRQKSELQGK